MKELLFQVKLWLIIVSNKFSIHSNAKKVVQNFIKIFYFFNLFSFIWWSKLIRLFHWNNSTKSRNYALTVEFQDAIYLVNTILSYLLDAYGKAKLRNVGSLQITLDIDPDDLEAMQMLEIIHS